MVLINQCFVSIFLANLASMMRSTKSGSGILPLPVMPLVIEWMRLKVALKDNFLSGRVVFII